MVDLLAELHTPSQEFTNTFPEILSLKQIRTDLAYQADELLKPGADINKIKERMDELVLMAAGLDPLVESVANKQFFNHRLDQEVTRSHRTSSPLTLIVLDLDNFKFVNNILGHLKGDEALQDVGKLLRGAVRMTDTVGRLGGDEFGLILPDTSSFRGLIVAIRILDAIPALTPKSPNDESIPLLGTSIGIAELDSNEKAESFFEKADKHGLLTVKQKGKNAIGLVINGGKNYSLENLKSQILSDEKIDPASRADLASRIADRTILVHR